MVIRNLLDVSICGIGKLHKTPIFPCGIFQCMTGVNRKEGDPNYDLFKLALKSTSMRLYPNYANVNWSGNAGYDPNDPKTYFSTMGALAGHEHLYVKINDDCFDTSIQNLFNYVKTGEMKQFRPCSVFYNKQRTELKGDKHVQNKSDIEVGPGVYAITYIPEDVTYIGSSSNVNRRLTEHRSSLRLTGGVDAGVCFGDTNLDHYKFEILDYCDNYKEAEANYIENVSNVNFKGTGERYYKTTHGNKAIHERPSHKQDPTIPQDIIDVKDKDIKVLDRFNKWVKVNHIYKNDKRNSPFMMHIYYSEFDNHYCLTCTEDHPLWTGASFTRADKLKVGDCLYRADGEKLTITDISWHWDTVDSYDIGTVTGSFIGSDIIMHNCRTANGFDINGFGQLKDGRGNICPTTIILPTLAMEAAEGVLSSFNGESADKLITDENFPELHAQIVEDFMELLDKKIHEARNSLIDRFNWICSQKPESASFMYENGTMEGYDGKDIRSALKHGTLAVGMLGMAEALQLLIGQDQTSKEGMALAKRICQLYKDRCNEFKQKYKLNFGVYFTPAENLCYTSMTKFKKKYGVIKNVSDKDYFTNSIHVPVWESMTPFDKIDIESQLTGYSSAGCITYVELDSTVKHNTEAIEEVVNYAMDHDIPYFAINIPNDTCLNCGYTDEINDACPMCGGTSIQRLRRVTGYLTGNYTTAFNKGKRQETEMRVKHTGIEI